MKKSFVSLAAMLLLLAGCQKPELVDTVGDNSAFEASFEAFDCQTKTSMNSSRKLVWSKGDRLAVFQGSSLADEYMLVESYAGKMNGDFAVVKDNSPVNGNFSAGSELPCNVAIYPYSDGLTLEGSVFEGGSVYSVDGFSLPSVQVYKAGSFAVGAFPMAAVTESMADHGLNFKNILGAMQLSLKGTQVVESIKIEGLSGEKLSGDAAVSVYTNDVAPTIRMSDEASTSVTLDCEDGVQLSESEATDFYIALPPMSFEKGFNVTVKDAAGQEYTITADQSNDVLRSSILVMPAVTLGAESFVLYSNDFDKTISTKVNDKWPFCDEFDGWKNEVGTGASNVSYSFKNASARAYSGNNNIWLPMTGAYFGVHNIELNNTTSYELTFNVICGTPGNYKETFSSSVFKVYLSQDDTKWVELLVNVTANDNVFDSAAASFSVPANTANLSVVFEKVADETNGYRVDNISLKASASADTEIDFAQGVEKDFTADSDGGGSAGGNDAAQPTTLVKATIAEFMAAAEDDTWYELTGEIISIEKETYGNFTIKDETGEVYVYGMTNGWVGSNDQSFSKIGLKVGDVVTLGTKRTSYQGTPQGGGNPVPAYYISHVAGQVGDAFDAKDYVDEYNVNHGPGVEIDGVVWAPVNCGYHEDDYKWGKLYQWGRKYGQGYDGRLYVNGAATGYISDKSSPGHAEGPVSVSDGNSESSANTFFVDYGSGDMDWVTPHSNTLWNSCSEDSPVKTENDPCPEGWRVPTYNELNNLCQNHSEWMNDEDGQPGYWLCGTSSYTESVPQVFFPAAGNNINIVNDGRGKTGYYWSSRPINTNQAYCLEFAHSSTSWTGSRYRMDGQSVRCVQD